MSKGIEERIADKIAEETTSPLFGMTFANPQAKQIQLTMESLAAGIEMQEKKMHDNFKAQIKAREDALKAEFAKQMKQDIADLVKRHPRPTMYYGSALADSVPDDYTYNIRVVPGMAFNDPRLFAKLEEKKHEPISYEVFQETVNAVVKQHAPNVKVVTDCSTNRFILWLECNGVKYDSAFSKLESVESITNTIIKHCTLIRTSLGQRAVGICP